MLLVWQHSATRKETFYSMNLHMAVVTSPHYTTHFIGRMASVPRIMLGWQHSALFYIWCFLLLVGHHFDGWSLSLHCCILFDNSTSHTLWASNWELNKVSVTKNKSCELVKFCHMNCTCLVFLRHSVVWLVAPAVSVVTALNIIYECYHIHSNSSTYLIIQTLFFVWNEIIFFV